MFAGDSDGLVVAGVYPEVVGLVVFGWLGVVGVGETEVVIFGGVGVGGRSRWDERGQTGVGGDLDGVGFEDFAARGVVDGADAVLFDLGRDVLNEGTTEVDVEGLGSVADGEDGFVVVEGVVDEELVDGGAGGVGGAAGGDGCLAVGVGVDVCS